MISIYKSTHKPSKSQKEINKHTRRDFAYLLNRGLDQVLRIGAKEVLNSGEVSIPLSHPAKELSILSKALKSEAMDSTGERIDYRKLVTSEAYLRFKEFTHALPYCDITDLGEYEDQMAFWINLYNALIIDAIIHYRIEESVLRMPSFFRRAAYDVGGHRFSADDIEHGILRINRPHPFLRVRPFGESNPKKSAMVRRLDARLHFALVCGALSCPPIAAYEGTYLDKQLSISASSFINGGGVSYDPDEETIWLSKIFKWYQGDFVGWDGVKTLICEASTDPELCKAIKRKKIKTRYQPYDWSINHLL